VIYLIFEASMNVPLVFNAFVFVLFICIDRFESLPDEVDRSVSEVTFTVNYVAPVLNSILRINGRTDVQ